MSTRWIPFNAGSISFKSRYDCRGVIVVKLVSPSARELLRDNRQSEFEVALGMVISHWKGYGRKAEYQKTVPGSWV